MVSSTGVQIKWSGFVAKRGSVSLAVPFPTRPGEEMLTSPFPLWWLGGRGSISSLFKGHLRGERRLRLTCYKSYKESSGT